MLLVEDITDEEDFQNRWKLLDIIVGELDIQLLCACRWICGPHQERFHGMMPYSRATWLHLLQTAMYAEVPLDYEAVERIFNIFGDLGAD